MLAPLHCFFYQGLAEDILRKVEKKARVFVSLCLGEKKASADCGYVSKAPASIVYEDFAWERYYDLSSAEIGELIRFPKMGEGLVGQMRRNLSTKLGVSTLDSFEMSDGD